MKLTAATAALYRGRRYASSAILSESFTALLFIPPPALCTRQSVKPLTQPDASLQLRPRSSPFAVFQLSLSAEQQAALARWARGDFQAGDEQLSAAESPLVRDEEEAAVPADRQICAYPHLFHSCCQTFRSEAGRASEGENEEVEEEKQTL